MKAISEEFERRRKQIDWDDWKTLPPPAKPDYTGKSLDELYDLLDDTSFIPISASCVLELLVKEFGGDNILKIVKDTIERLKKGEKRCFFD